MRIKSGVLVVGQVLKKTKMGLKMEICVGGPAVEEVTHGPCHSQNCSDAIYN